MSYKKGCVSCHIALCLWGTRGISS
jgi:hypothetical protein